MNRIEELSIKIYFRQRQILDIETRLDLENKLLNELNKCLKQLKLHENMDVSEYERLIENQKSKNKRKNVMDKQINKVKKDIESGNKKKGEKDTKKLLKMDKKFDKKLEKCGMMEKKGKK